MFPLTRVPFWYWLFEPIPYVSWPPKNHGTLSHVKKEIRGERKGIYRNGDVWTNKNHVIPLLKILLCLRKLPSFYQLDVPSSVISFCSLAHS